MDVTDAASSRQRPVGLAELARIPLRRWRILFGSVLVLLLAAVGYLWVVPASYTATSVVVVRPVVTDPFTLPSGGADRAVNMTAESGFATSNDVIDRVAAAVGRPADEVAEALTVETPVGGQLLRFSYAGTSERQALDGANGAADAYLRLRKGMYESQRSAVLKSYEDTIALVTAQRTTVQGKLPNGRSNSSPSPQTSALLDQLRGLNDQLAQLAEQRSKIASADLTPGTVTATARPPVQTSRDGRALIVLAALLGGVLVGAVLALVRESFDRRIRSADDAAELIGAPMLGSVPRPGRRGLPEPELRYLALAVERWTGDRDRPLVLLADGPGAVRTQLAAGLAATLAEAGDRVRLGATAEDLRSIRPALLTAQRRIPTVPPGAADRPGPARRPAPAANGRADTAAASTAAQPGGAPSGTAPSGIAPSGIVPADIVPAGGAPAVARTAGQAGSGEPDAPTVVVPAVDPAAAPPARRPRPYPARESNNGAVYRSFTLEEEPVAERRPAESGSAPPAAPAEAMPATAVPTDPMNIGLRSGGSAEALSLDQSLLRIGAGRVQLVGIDAPDGEGTLLITAPDGDQRGVRAARLGVAVLVVARDRTRSRQLDRSLSRLAAAGVRPVGFVLTGDGRA
ncbi:hypothetical protein ACFFWC_24270 [Plantactinospora siamensis]|uniref:Lipopolysaccharide biosynthesis protein n=1 Tax=Plantactinospora siamensis TaxID=555372 RepID=A0ABV6P6B7_9ACTN